VRRHLFVPVLLLPLLAACGARDPAPQLEDLALPAAAGSLAPRLAAAADGALVASWLEPDGTGHALRYALLRDGQWQAPRAAARGDDWFVNWADTPGVFAHGRLLVAHWLRRAGGGTYAYDVQLSVSADGGATWSAPTTPHHDGVAAEHGFVSWFPDGAGFGLVWLDGRNAAAEPPSSEDHASAGHDGHASAAAGAARGHAAHGAVMTIRYALFDGAGQQTHEGTIDESTCDCCPTDLAATADGALLVYRDRTAEELRDVYATRFTGGRWTPPVAVHVDSWRMPGCPVNGPAAAADGARAVVAWFTAAGEVPQVLLGWSADAGASFAAPTRIDGGKPVGRVAVVLEGDAAQVLWLEQAGATGAELRFRRAWADGTLGAPRVLATTAAARASGFPRAARIGDATYLAWTDVGGDGRRQVRVGRLR
jgi:hypothetical protein